MGIRKLAAVSLAVMMSLAACGGGGSADINSNAGSSGSSGNPQTGSGGQTSGGENPAGQSGFTIASVSAPADGASVSDLVRIEVEGAGIANAELLPAAGGRPYALFNIAPDNSRAWVEFDTRTVSNGELRVVIDAFDSPPRTAGASVIRAMQPRTWTVQNDAISSPYPGEYPLRRDAAPLQTMLDLSEEEFSRLIDAEWPRIHALLQEYIPNNVVFNPPVPLGFEGPRSSCIQDAYASPLACREYMLRIVMLLS